MEKNKNNIILYVVAGVIVLGLVMVGVYTRMLSGNNKNNNEMPNNNVLVPDTDEDENNNEDKIPSDDQLLFADDLKKETPLKEMEIKNSEVKKLYEYTQASLKSNYVCKGYYYSNPFKNHTLEDKISIVLINYAENYKKEVNDKFVQQLSKEEQDEVKMMASEYYVSPDDVKKGMKLIFNIDINEFDAEKSYSGYVFLSKSGVFVQKHGGGAYEDDIIQQIIDYKELSDEISLTVVKAEVNRYDDDGFPRGVYRTINKLNTLVYKDVTNEFKFTKENVSKFPQIKYVFKKNNNGKYYVSDIVNLNYEEDFYDCANN